jgi:hypothetical protein
LVQRDTDTPDQGWHADPIDWALGSLQISNATLSVTPGTVLAGYGSEATLYLDNAGVLNAGGSPTNLVRLVRYNTAQEQAITNWSSSSPGDLLVGGGGSMPTAPVARFRFADFSVPGGGPCIFDGYASCLFTTTFRDSQFHGGLFQCLNADLFLTNCLFERVAFNASDGGAAFNLLAWNNTFYGGSFYNDHIEAGTWTFRNNLFDKTVITSTDNTDNANSGYVTNATRLTPTSSTDVVQTSSTNISFQTGWLGRFYLPTNAVFINKGNTNADLLTFWHYTAQTNQVKETNSLVDIGFHYVAVDANGQPIDTDSDGTPDYLEDANGNGTVNSGETDWQDPFDFGLRVRITYPRQ